MAAASICIKCIIVNCISANRSNVIDLLAYFSKSKFPFIIVIKFNSFFVLREY
jgi:hypothetical protein